MKIISVLVFGEKPPKGLPQRIQQMYRLFGKTDGKKCKTCAHLIAVGHSRTYYKCEKSNVSSSAATDWRVGWDACGLYAKPRDLYGLEEQP